MLSELPTAFLFSGGGTTMEAVLNAKKTGRLSEMRPVCALTDNPDAGGIRKALAGGLSKDDVICLKRRDFQSSLAYGEAMISELKRRGAQAVLQLGWTMYTPANVIAAFEGWLSNQHPCALDPGYLGFGGKGMVGLAAHAARLWFVRTTKRAFWTEATAQRVSAKYDEGELLITERIPILEKDTVLSLKERLLPVEYEVQIRLIEAYLAGTLRGFTRSDRLVIEGEEGTLADAKAHALKMFPFSP